MKIQYKRYYYSDDKKFEKSLDVYKPKGESNNNDDDDDNNNNNNNNNNSNNNNNESYTTAVDTTAMTATTTTNENDNNHKDNRKKPIIVLVVGSGWMGHRSWIYSGTSWWNSSCPKSFAKCGYTCICIRHRGAFFAASQWEDSYILGMFLTVACLTFMVTKYIESGNCFQWTLINTMVAVICYMLLLLGETGSSHVEDMLNDVREALAWIQRNQQQHSHRIVVQEQQQSQHPNETPQSEPPVLPLPPQPIVFGGYSSGGHIAATLIQQPPEFFTSHGLPLPKDWFHAILLISGVLAVRPFDNIHSNDNDTNEYDDPTNRAFSSTPPRWFTDFVMNVVWGPTKAERIPSPLHGIMNHKMNTCCSWSSSSSTSSIINNENLNLNPTTTTTTTTTTTSLPPHFLIGCQKEMFGIPWLDVFFCSGAFVQALRSVGVTAEFVQVDSNHWNILNSTTFRKAIRHEFQPWFNGLSPCIDKQG